MQRHIKTSKDTSKQYVTVESVVQQGALMSAWNLSTQISPQNNTPPQIFESGRLKQPRCSIPRIFRLQSSETYVVAFFAKMGILNNSSVDARSFGWTYTQHTENQQHKSRGIAQGKCCNKKTGPGAKLDMGWLQRVGSLKLQVSSAEYCLFYRALLQKRPVILRSLLRTGKKKTGPGAKLDTLKLASSNSMMSVNSVRDLMTGWSS